MNDGKLRMGRIVMCKCDKVVYKGVLHVLVKGKLHPVNATCQGKYEVLEDMGNYYLHYWAWSLSSLQHRVNTVERGQYA